MDLLWEEMIGARTPSPEASFRETCEGKGERPWRHPPTLPRPTPGEGRRDEGSTDSAGRPRGVPTVGPTHTTRVLGLRRGAGLITILPVRMLKLGHCPGPPGC